MRDNARVVLAIDRLDGVLDHLAQLLVLLLVRRVLVRVTEGSQDELRESVHVKRGHEAVNALNVLGKRLRLGLREDEGAAVCVRGGSRAAALAAAPVVVPVALIPV